MIEDQVNIEVVNEIKLLGTVITSDLSWNMNTKFLTKRAYGRMQLLHKAAKFTKSKKDLKSIFITFIRPVLEQSSSVWHSSLTDENKSDLERVQKAAVKVIMGNDYIDYNESLKALNISNLAQRREKLIKNMAIKITNHPKVKNMLPLRTELRSMTRRHTEKYKLLKANTHRLQASAIPYMQRIMNQHDEEQIN